MMAKVSSYLILVAIFITLDLYRFPVMGYNITLYHLFLAPALVLALLTVLLNVRPKVVRGVKIALGILIVFGSYSFLTFLKNVDIRHEAISMFMAELIGYSMVLIVPLSINNWKNLRRITIAFIASAVFIYLGSFWHTFVFVTRGEYVTGIPLWRLYSRSESVVSYIEKVVWFEGLPRFRLPFSTPAGAGIFLSLSGIFLLSFALQHIATKRRVSLWLIVLNLVNFLCLLGTFTRTGWFIFLVGSMATFWYFHKFKLISFARTTLTLVFVVGFLFTIVNLVPVGNDFVRLILSRLNLKYSWQWDIGHVESRVLALRYWTESPIVGLGVGGFWEKPGGGMHTHSTYFTLLVERGLIGLLLFLTFFFQIYRLLTRKMQIIWKSNDTIMLTYNIAFLSSIIGLFWGHFLYQINTEFIWLYYSLTLAYLNLPFPVVEG